MLLLAAVSAAAAIRAGPLASPRRALASCQRGACVFAMADDEMLTLDDDDSEEMLTLDGAEMLTLDGDDSAEMLTLDGDDADDDAADTAADAVPSGLSVPARRDEVLPPVPTLDEAAATAAASAADPADPAALTLELLEWPRLSSHVASFAGTATCRAAMAAGLAVPTSRGASEALLAETAEAHRLEGALARTIDLRGFGDVSPLATLAGKGGVLTGEQLATVERSLAAAAALRKVVRGAADDDPAALLTVLPALLDGVPVQAELRRAIGEAVDEGGAVRDSAEPTLGQLRFELRDVAAGARRDLAALIQRKGDALASTSPIRRGDRFVLQVIAKQKHRVPGVVRDVSASGQTLYVEPKEVEATNTKLKTLAKREAAAERRVLAALSKRVGEPKVLAELRTLQAAVERIDAAAARARYATHVGARPVALCDPPRRCDDAEAAAVAAAAAEGCNVDGVSLRALRHPLLVWRSPAEAPDASAVVPMDFRVPAGVRGVVITGPNTGGKTVALKTLGISALMAKAGLWPLCDGDGGGGGGDDDDAQQIPWFDTVMADIGDDQSIVQSLSTFSAHVRRVQRILGSASEASLVLLDEVGSGTDPTEGAALGMALLRSLADRAALTMCTTHHGRLKSLKYGDRRFENACVEFDVESLAPTYRLLWGIPGKSNALAIARRLGLQPAVVDDARGLLTEEEVSIEEVVAELQQQRDEARQLNAALVARRVEAERAAAEAAAATAAAQQEQRQMRAALERDLAGELAAAKAQVSALLKEASAAAPSSRAAAAQRASRELGKVARGAADAAAAAAAPAAAAAAAAAPPATSEVGAGDLVLVPSLGEAPVHVESRKGGQLTVVFGGLKMKVKLKDVAKVVQTAAAAAAAAPAKPKKPKRGGGGGAARTRTAVKLDGNTVDVRGERAADVGAPLARGLDRAAELGTCFVVHGHGDLRRAVRLALDDEPMVVRYEDADAASGGAGCTVVYLK